MPPDPVVEHLDILEQLGPRLGPRGEVRVVPHFLLERGIIHLHSASALSGPARPVESAGWSDRTGASAGRDARPRRPAAGGVARVLRHPPTRSTGHFPPAVA